MCSSDLGGAPETEALLTGAEDSDPSSSSSSEKLAGKSRKMEARNEHLKIRHYKTIYSLTTSIGVGLFIFLLAWILKYRGGFAWHSQPSIQFNWHPFFMILSLIFLYSQSILIYRTYRNTLKRKLKLLHASLHLLAFIFAVIGLKAVFDSHNFAKPNPIPNLYTLHSWIGLITVIIFSFQYVIGFITFLYPGLAKTLRQTMMPVHVAFGIGGFVLALISAMTGLMEKAIWALDTNYSKYSSESILVNIMGLFIVAYGVLVIYLVNEVDYKRHALPDDEIALTESE